MLCTTHDVVNWDLTEGVDVADITMVQQAAKKQKKVDVLINCAGYNYMDWIGVFPEAQFNEVMAINVRSIFLTAKYLVDKMRKGTILNIISNASHVPMNCSIAYNASKGAAEIMTRQMAKELWQTHDITVFGISPGKMFGTAMTTKGDVRAAELRHMDIEEAHRYQLSKILIREEINPFAVAEFACWLLAEKHRHKFLAGCVLEYGA